MAILRTDNLVHEFTKRGEDDEILEVRRAVDDVNLSVQEGEFIAILGRNGSGKSTLARHLNALLAPTSGTVFVAEMDTRDETHLWEIRQTAGMVFQNPDNQIIATEVEEDVGFGPENLGVPTEEIWRRVEEALARTGMSLYAKAAPHRLSGGQKQRVAVAGILAMKPRCILLDEPTAMLDPNGRREVLETVRELNRQEGITVLLITHYMEETVFADRIFVMEKGRLTLQGTPAEVFARPAELAAAGLALPPAVELADRLRAGGMPLPEGILEADGLVRAVLEQPFEDARTAKLDEAAENAAQTAGEEPPVESDPGKAGKGSDTAAAAPMLRLSHVTYTYEPGTAMEHTGVEDICLEFGKGEFVGLIGQTGSGKSTLIQLLNGLLKPTAGQVLADGTDIFSPKYDRKALRSRVGLVFQYPEHQLFETEVLKDICFGPKNQGLDEEAQKARARAAMRLVELDESYEERSPFELSGGEKRRVAIAGVLAMQPELCVLDEPTAGLDPKGRDELLRLLKKLQEEQGLGIVLVSHSMEDVARFADRLVVLSQGHVVRDAAPREVFAEREMLETIGLSVPEVTRITAALRAGGLPLRRDALSVEEAAEMLLRKKE